MLPEKYWSKQRRVQTINNFLGRKHSSERNQNSFTLLGEIERRKKDAVIITPSRSATRNLLNDEPPHLTDCHPCWIWVSLIKTRQKKPLSQKTDGVPCLHPWIGVVTAFFGLPLQSIPCDHPNHNNNVPSEKMNFPHLAFALTPHFLHALQFSTP